MERGDLAFHDRDRRPQIAFPRSLRALRRAPAAPPRRNRCCRVRAALTPIANSSLTLPKLLSPAIRLQRRSRSRIARASTTRSLSSVSCAGRFHHRRDVRRSWPTPRGSVRAAAARTAARPARDSCAAPGRDACARPTRRTRRTPRDPSSAASRQSPSCRKMWAGMCRAWLECRRQLRERAGGARAPARACSDRRRCGGGSAARPDARGCDRSTSSRISATRACISLPASVWLWPSCASS